MTQPTKSDGLIDSRPVAQTWGLPTDRQLEQRVMKSLFGAAAEPVSFGRYEIRRRIGRGAMGSVYLAHDPQLDRQIAIKVLHYEIEADDSALLAQEARAMARVQHPNVVAVYDVGEVEGRFFIAMERIVGGSLRDWFKSERRSWREIARVFRDAARGLAAAHEAGIVHRDFKPDNVLVADDGRVAVGDFGLARVGGTALEAETTAPGPPATDKLALPHGSTPAIIGTPAYLAPEVVIGQVASGASDQFSFGVSLYEALYGQRPFRVDGTFDLLSDIVNNRREPKPNSRRVPLRLDAVVERCLESDLGDRYNAMSEVADALDRTLTPIVRRVAVPVAVAAVIGGYWVGTTASEVEAPPCSDGSQRFEGVWDLRRRGEVQDALLGTGLPHARAAWAGVSGGLDAYVERWRLTHLDACEAHRERGEQSEAVFDARMLCLDRARRDVNALVEVLADPDRAVVDRSVEAVARLPRIGRCNDLEALAARVPQPESEAQQQSVDSLEEQLARLRALDAAGRFDDALTLSRQVAQDARNVDYAPAVAVSLRLLGIAQANAGEVAKAEVTLEEAFVTALETGLDTKAASIASSLTHIIGENPKRADDGMRWYRTALALVRRSRSQGGYDEAWLHSHAGTVLMRAGRFDEARQRSRTAVALGEGLDPPDPTSLAAFLSNLGAIEIATGHFDAAKGMLQRSLELREAALGPDHPRLINTLNNLATVGVQTSSPADSVAHLERALSILDKFEGGEPAQGRDSCQPGRCPEFERARRAGADAGRAGGRGVRSLRARRFGQPRDLGVHRRHNPRVGGALSRCAHHRP